MVDSVDASTDIDVADKMAERKPVPKIFFQRIILLLPQLTVLQVDPKR
jgi:hypothetical protein